MVTAATTLFELDDSYARAVPSLSTPWRAAPVPSPELLVLNEELAAELGVDAATVLAEQAIRDQRDTTREHSPLRPAEGSIELDTTGLTLEEVVDRVTELVRGRR